MISHSGPSKNSLKIIVADDTDTDRLILEAIVKREGHEVISAVNGLEAVAAFEQHRPDIVLMDALMPELDGFEAARQIKAMAGEQLIPIIFLTSLSDTESLVKCLDAGGDDFLSKPYNRVILQAKIKSFNRMREMHATMLEQKNQISLHNEHLLQEQSVAKQVFDNIAHSGCLDAGNIKYYLSPLAVFNGDVLLASKCPSGNMFILLGDFTGHGLPAAIGAMPLAAAFYSMAGKGFSMTDILREINHKLKSILPIGVFCCATMVDINYQKRIIKIWNGGLPDCIIYRGGTGKVEKIHSRHLPLGVLANTSFRDDTLQLTLELGDRFFMSSDGIHEARNDQGEMFGEERLVSVFQNNQEPKTAFDDVLASVQRFVGDSEKDDDLSLVEVLMVNPEEVDAEDKKSIYSGISGLMEWALDFEVKWTTFKVFDPLPLLLNILVEVPGLRRHFGRLYTILSELYNNALEHGVLGLDSSQKSTKEGYARYYEQRQKRLEAVNEGFIHFHFTHQLSEAGGKLTIVLKDSGKGFNHREILQQVLLESKRAGEGDKTGSLYSGRGIALVNSMCDSLRFHGDGSEIEAVYSWNNDDG